MYIVHIIFYYYYYTVLYCVCIIHIYFWGTYIPLDRLPGGELMKRSRVLTPTYLIYTHNANCGSIVPQTQAYYYITAYSIGIYTYTHTHINRHSIGT